MFVMTGNKHLFSVIGDDTDLYGGKTKEEINKMCQKNEDKFKDITSLDFNNIKMSNLNNFSKRRPFLFKSVFKEHDDLEFTKPCRD